MWLRTCGGLEGLEDLARACEIAGIITRGMDGMIAMSYSILVLLSRLWAGHQFYLERVRSCSSRGPAAFRHIAPCLLAQYICLKNIFYTTPV